MTITTNTIELGTAFLTTPVSESADKIFIQEELDEDQRMIQEALLKAGGNKARAAEALGLSRQGLLKKIKRMAITP